MIISDIFYRNHEKKMDNLGSSILKLLITILSLAIVQPGFWEDDYRVVTLTLALFFLSRIVDTIQQIGKGWYHFFAFVKTLEIVSGIFGAGLCFYYIAVIFSIGTERIDGIMRYPFITYRGFPVILMGLSAVFVCCDILQCGMAAYKKWMTHNEVMKVVNGGRMKR